MKIRAATPNDAQAIAEVHVASWKTTYAGIFPDSFLAELTPETRLPQWERTLGKIASGNNSKCVFVAEDGLGRVIGFVSGGVPQKLHADFDCELYSIYIYKDHQGFGVGSSLTLELAKWLDQSGFKKMYLWVSDRNPSRKFYEAIGGTEGVTEEDVVQGVKTLHICYGYDVKDLLTGLENEKHPERI